MRTMKAPVLVDITCSAMAGSTRPTRTPRSSEVMAALRSAARSRASCTCHSRACTSSGRRVSVIPVRRMRGSPLAGLLISGAPDSRKASICADSSSASKQSV